MANVITFEDLLTVYEAGIESTISRYSRGYFTLEEAKNKIFTLDEFFQELSAQVFDQTIYKILTIEDEDYIEYRGQRGKIIDDDPGQQMVLKFRDKEYGTGAYNFMWEYDMCHIIDQVLLEEKLLQLENTVVREAK